MTLTLEQLKLAFDAFKSFRLTEDGLVVSPIKDYMSRPFNLTKWNKDTNGHGFCFFFNEEDSLPFLADMIYLKSATDVTAFVKKVEVKGHIVKGINDYYGVPSVSAFTAKAFRFVDEPPQEPTK